ncbi:DUF4136 domain-containing protein [Pseudoflavitalea sp. X16]|uniref:DUF4136 domain-containing protein n=1 Tax=Paraflavitalea devenefica TaxID=2716334 RepID=UPI00141FB7EC|nr:DUF4136 domain-containing protein [Paraflavitalea devenefica]NII25314.1 DUF4136 domain-containing protein [Paraflavitalea devenefica]
MNTWKLSSMALVLPILLAVGCAAPAHIERDETADFTQYKTFAWVASESKDKKEDKRNEKDDRKNDKKEDKARRNDLVDRQVQLAVNKELEKQGWKEDKNRPDVLISYDVLVERTTRESSNPVYSRPYSRIFYNPYLRRYGTIYYPSTFLGYDDNTVSVREGTLTVTMVDAKTDNTVWQGWTTDEVSSRNLTQKEIQSSVRSIFRKFDVVTK